MKNRKWIALLAALLLCAGLLSGCRLARDGETAESARLVGVAVRVPGEPDSVVETEEGVMVSWADGSGEETETLGDYRILFEQEEGEEGRGLVLDGFWPGDGHSDLRVTDDGEEYLFTGTLYLSATTFREDSYAEVMLDSVYREADGTLSTRTMGGMSGYVDGSRVSASEEETVSTPSESHARKVGWEVALRVVPALRSARVLAFDGQYDLLGEIPIDLGAETLSCRVPAGAACLVLETVSVDRDGGETVSRRIASREEWQGKEESPFTLYLPQENGLCLPAEVALEEVETPAALR